MNLTAHLSAVQRLLNWGLPELCSRFLWRQPGEFPVTTFLLGAGTGGLLAIGECGGGRLGGERLDQGGSRAMDLQLHPGFSGLFQLLVNPMNIYEEQKMVVLYGLVG